MESQAKSDSRLVVMDNDRTLRNRLDKLAELEIYGTNASEVVRVLVAQAYLKHFSEKELKAD